MFTGILRPCTLQIAAISLAGFAATASIPAAFAQDWQLSYGPFTTAADVSNHNRMPLDIADVNASLASAEPDWSEALSRFAFGGHFANHSLAIFTDNYNGRLTTHLSVSTEHFGSPSFQNHAINAALVGSGAFRRVDDEIRTGFIETALISVAINWARYELGESERKALMDEPNWSLQNGSPKNWNEIFAFYWGPDGQYSAFEAVAAIDGGEAINAALLDALAEGQDVLLTEVWADVEAERVKTVLDRASIVLFADALNAAALADADTLPSLRARAAGYWLAAAEALAADEALAERIESALWGEPDLDLIAGLASEIAGH